MENKGIAMVFVAAVAANGVIGGDNRLLWRLKSDLKHFRALTMGRAMIMGRKTFESIGNPLPGRHSIVVTRDLNWRAEGVQVVHSLDDARIEALRYARETEVDEFTVAGGGEIFAALMAEADRLEITAVALEPHGDVYFPTIDPALWRLSRREDHPAGPDDEAAFVFLTYLKR